MYVIISVSVESHIRSNCIYLSAILYLYKLFSAQNVINVWYYCEKKKFCFYVHLCVYLQGINFLLLS